MTLAALLLLADLEIASVTPAKTALTTDETFTVAVRVHNRGPEDAKDVKVTVGVNALSFLKELRAPKGWSCERGPVFGYAMSCTASSFAKDAEAELTMTLATPQHSAMTYRVSSLVETDAGGDENGKNDRLEQKIGIEATDSNAELSLTTKIEANQVGIDVKNTGPHDAKDVMVVLSEPGNLPFKASGRGWKCDGAVCTRPLLKTGTSAPLTVTAAEGATISARVRAERNRESAKDNAANATLP